MNAPIALNWSLLPEDCCVRVVGEGGVGGIVTRYAAMFLASQNVPSRMVLIDGDKFEDSNATRMFFSAAGNKAAVVRADLLDRFAESALTLIAIDEYVTPGNIERVLGKGGVGEILMVCVDNHATRKLVAEYAGTLRDICVISGGNDGVGADASGKMRHGTFGSCQIHLRRNDMDLSPSLSRFHPEISQPADKLPTDLSCTELVASMPQILFANLTAASAMLNTLWLHLCGRLEYPEVNFDIALGRMSPVPLPMKKIPAAAGVQT
jgi:hypothetical protein